MGSIAMATVKLAELFLEGTKCFVLFIRGSMYHGADPWLMKIGMVTQTAAVSGPRIAEREVAFTIVSIVVDIEVGCQIIGPTSIVHLCDVVVVPVVPFGGASPSPPNPTGIGGARGNH